MSIELLPQKRYNYKCKQKHTAERHSKKGKVKMMKFLVKVYDGCKYDAKSKKITETIYNDVASLEVKTMTDEEIFADGFDETDEYSEYAIITHADGTTSTFRNSHVDIFRA